MSTVAQASPNIAFIKYWGKLASTSDQDRNMAQNPSLSLTLSQAKSTVEISRAEQNEFYIQGSRANELDEKKLRAHVQRVCEAYLKPAEAAQARFRIHSANNFPKGTGIASSASAFAALTVGLVAEITEKSKAEDELKNNLGLLSQLARRGSGSAARSVAGPFMKWDGEAAVVIESPWKLYDTILIFSEEAKKVSSTDGHARALSSTEFPARLKRIPQRMRLIEEAIRTQDLQALGPVLEEEAYEMHAIARTSHPPIDYALPATKVFLAALRELKSRSFFYTLDAGPNVHLISERPIGKEISTLLGDLNLAAKIWEDWTGPGPVIVSRT